ncbi:arginine--tRNA ligase [Candidatus Woesearchaeota archaeon]|nr:arginine--tRNA ligase [Candidatus Woesearchaeota archaeon]
MDEFKRAVAEAIAKAAGMPQEEVMQLIAVPPDSSMGDYAFPCFALSKQMRKSPVEIASELQRKVRTGGLIEKAAAQGPYLNFFVNKAMLAEAAITAVLREKDGYGSLKLKGKKALIEHTSINPNASPHVGRARNAILGDALARLLRFHGYKTEVHYYVNDIGKQIAMLVLGCEGKRKLEFKDLLDEYIRINAEIEKSPELEQKAFALLKKLDDRDKKTIAEFRRVVQLCVTGQKRIMEGLGIKYDFFDYESAYLWSRKTEEVMQKLEATGKVFVDDEGRRVINLEGFSLAMKSPVFVLTRADGTSLYGLRDMAYNIEKTGRAKGRNIVVLGEDHKLYFRQVEAALSLIGLKAPEVVHYAFILLPEGKMSTRSGNLVLLEDFMRQAAEKAEKEVLARNKSISSSELKKLAEAIGYGAIKYHIIKVSPEKNVMFSWEQALSFEGESAPYIQYAHARICSILKKAGSNNKKIKSSGLNYSLLQAREETELAKIIADFPNAAAKAEEQLRPHIIANYTQMLADRFNSFYHACPVITEDKGLMDARIALIKAVKQVLETGLGLLGIEAVERM